MTPDEAMAAVATGARAEARHHHTPTPVAVGRVVAYSLVPMVLLVDGDGVHHWHRHDMVELAPPLEQAAPGRWEGDDS